MQYIFWDVKAGGLKYSRTLMRMPDPQKWSAEKVAMVRATPWTVYAEKKPEVVFKDKAQIDEQAVRQQIAQVRRLYIRQQDLDEFGYTQGVRAASTI